MVRSAEALTALRAMLADVEAFDEQVLTRLSLRATMPIADKDRALHLHEMLMAAVAGLKLGDFFLAHERERQLRDANATLDAIEAATRP
jgi:hypothetical protein